MGQFHFVALRAAAQSCGLQRVVCAARARSALGVAAFGIRHYVLPCGASGPAELPEPDER